MTIVFKKNETTAQCIASTTKIMTALVALDLITDMTATVTVSSSDLVGSNESRVNFSAGDIVTYKDLLYGLLVRSGNDAANCLARNLGGISSFLSKMNAKAASLAMTVTNFADAPGINYQTVSSASDMSKLMAEYAKNATLVTMSSTWSYAVAITGVNARTIEIKSFMQSRIVEFPEILCIKDGVVTFGSGYEQYDSGNCLTAVWRLPNGDQRVTILLGVRTGINDALADLRKLIDFEILRSKVK